MSERLCNVVNQHVMCKFDLEPKMKKTGSFSMYHANGTNQEDSCD